jgi:hypothetical protein
MEATNYVKAFKNGIHNFFTHSMWAQMEETLGSDRGGWVSESPTVFQEIKELRAKPKSESVVEEAHIEISEPKTKKK